MLHTGPLNLFSLLLRSCSTCRLSCHRPRLAGCSRGSVSTAAVADRVHQERLAVVAAGPAVAGVLLRQVLLQGSPQVELLHTRAVHPLHQLVQRAQLSGKRERFVVEGRGGGGDVALTAATANQFDKPIFEEGACFKGLINIFFPLSHQGSRGWDLDPSWVKISGQAVTQSAASNS